jgi:hypothetical protein
MNISQFIHQHSEGDTQPEPNMTTGINVNLLRAVLEHVTDNPGEYDSWSYARENPRTGRVTRDLAGTACWLSGLVIRFDKLNSRKEAYLLADGRRIEDAATELLRLDEAQAYALFQTTIGRGVGAVWGVAADITGGAIPVPAGVAADTGCVPNPNPPAVVPVYEPPVFEPSAVPLFCGRCRRKTPRLIEFPSGPGLCPRCAYPSGDASEVDAGWLKANP